MNPISDDYLAGAMLEPKQDRSRATRRLLLDAAVHELLAHGYNGLTTLAVAQRAGVSRGAQQNHFANKATLVGEALRHLADQRLSHLRDALPPAPTGPRDRAVIALDSIFDEYRGPLFRVVVELSLAARRTPELAELVAAEERGMVVEIERAVADIFGAEVTGQPGFPARWRTVLATIRGIAMLQLLGHPEEVVTRQWTRVRRHAVDLLLSPDSLDDPAVGGDDA